MFMPMVFALNNSQPNDRVVDLAKRLVPPLIGAPIDEFLDIDLLQRAVQNIQEGLIRKIL